MLMTMKPIIKINLVVCLLLLMVAVFIQGFFFSDQRDIDKQHNELSISNSYELIDERSGRVDCYHDGQTSCSATIYIYVANEGEMGEILNDIPIGKREFVEYCSVASVGYVVTEMPARSSSSVRRSVAEHIDLDLVRFLTVQKC